MVLFLILVSMFLLLINGNTIEKKLDKGTL